MENRKRLSLTTKIFIGLILGAFTGVILHYFVPAGYVRDTIFIDGIFHVVGNGFIRGMQMLVVLLVFSSLVTGSMSMGDTKKLGRVGIKTVLFYLVTTALAIAIALGVASLTNPGIGMNQATAKAAEAAATKAPKMVDTLLNIIPKNPIEAMAKGEMLQIIFFAIVVGILLANMGDRARTITMAMSELNDLMMDMTMAVMKVAPIGVFCLITKTFASLGYDALLPMMKYVIAVFSGLFIQCFVVYMLLLWVLTRCNPLTFFKKFLPVMGFAFSTASSNATVPLSIKTLDGMGISKKISSFTVPLGATVNMDGTAIMQGVAVIFVAQAYNITLTPTDYLTVIAAATLASIGTAGIPSVGLITLSMVFNSVGLPVEGIAMIMGIDRILDMTRTAVNVTGDAVVTVVMSKQEKLMDWQKFNS